MDATPNDGIISVSAYICNEKMTVVIKDNGRGIPEDLMPKILSGGFSTKEKGCGIGLSFAKQKIEESGGEFSIQSRPDYGTEISLVLPSKIA